MAAHLDLSRRERQIMDVLFKLGRATATEIQQALSDPPSNSAVRAHLRTLEEKGHVRHEAEDLRYVYAPVVKTEKARSSALRHLVDTFFSGSPGQAMAALLGDGAGKLSEEDLNRLQALIEDARRNGGQR
jgi:predicted transcriptional regulator